jgi:hypothetical protein
MAKSLLQTMEDAAADTNRMKVRDMLGSFLVSWYDVEKGKSHSEVKETVWRCVNCCSPSMFVDG